MRADLHIHTSVSDGVLSPSEVVTRAERAGLDIIAITDHDSLLAHVEGVSGTRCRVIVGFEFTTESRGREYHVLGYFDRLPGAEFLSRIEEESGRRRKRMRDAIQRLVSQGISMDVEEFFAEHPNPVITSAHIAHAMAARGLVESEATAYTEYLKGGLSVVPLPETPMGVAIRLINDAGGVSVWAHPPLEDLNDLLRDAVGQGLQGIEAVNFWHPERDPAPYRAAAAKYSLLTTGGTDYHADTRPCALGSRFVTEEQIGAFLDSL